MVIAALLVLTRMLAGAAQPASLDCTEAELEALSHGAQTLARGDEVAVLDAIGHVRQGSAQSCAPIKLARSSLLGWLEARRLAPEGGAIELLGPTSRALMELEALKASGIALEVEYAQIAIRAAIAAAQDERPELGLLLDHARDLSERVAARGRRAIWPRSYNLLAGELWLEVDRYEDARNAFHRAARAEGSPLALAGLAETLSKMNRHDEACATYRRVRGAAGRISEQTRTYLARCP